MSLDLPAVVIGLFCAGALAALQALDHREEFGFNFDPSHLHWQMVDPVRFLQAFPDRIYHVHMKDVWWSSGPAPSGGVRSTWAPSAAARS